jgi:hypothetical protein
MGAGEGEPCVALGLVEPDDADVAEWGSSLAAQTDDELKEMPVVPPLTAALTRAVSSAPPMFCPLRHRVERWVRAR